MTRWRNALALTTVAVGWLLTPLATAQWNPGAGEWGKSDPNDVRVMTWNVRDALCRNADKSETFAPWHAVARIVAAMRPDVLILQECGDNTGNGTSGGLDSISQLTTTLALFLHGGSDPYQGGTVGAYVQKYLLPADAGYDLPYIWVSNLSDGFNRNVILSRFPFADLNGDSVSQRSSPATVQAHLYAWGGDGGIRGFMFGELDLPDDTFAGDLVIGNAHLKAGDTSSDESQRERAARNMAYYIDHLFNGAGTGTPDPFNKIGDSPAAQTTLDANTPVIIGGDWNEDEDTNGRDGPAHWLTIAEDSPGTDGTDRDRSDATYDASTNPFNSERGTLGSTTKLDYIAWQDSIAVLRRSFVFYSNSLSGVPSWIPPELDGFDPPDGAHRPSSVASNHKPVIADFILPKVTVWRHGDMNCDNIVGFADINAFVLALVEGPTGYYAQYPACDYDNADMDLNGSVGFEDINGFVGCLTMGQCPD